MQWPSLIIFWNYRTSIALLPLFNTYLNKEFCFLQTFHIHHIKIENDRHSVCIPFLAALTPNVCHSIGSQSQCTVCSVQYTLYIVHICSYTYSYGKMNSANFVIKWFYIYSKCTHNRIRWLFRAWKLIATDVWSIHLLSFDHHISMQDFGWCHDYSNSFHFDWPIRIFCVSYSISLFAFHIFTLSTQHEIYSDILPFSEICHQ